MQLCQDCGRYHLNIQSCKATLLPVQLQAVASTETLKSRKRMKDPLTPEERDKFERVRSKLESDEQWVKYAAWDTPTDAETRANTKTLITIIDNLIPRVDKKFTEQEIAEKYRAKKKPELDETGNWFYEDWKECQQIIEHARFLGVLKENKK